MPVIVSKQPPVIKLSGRDIEPPDGSLDRVSAKDREDYWRQVAKEAFDAVTRQINSGKDIHGHRHRRKHKRRDGANGPFFSPHWSLSRVQAQVRYNQVGGREAVVYWRKPWSLVVGYWAVGVRGVVHDIVGLTAESLERLKARVWQWWAAKVATGRLGQAGVTMLGGGTVGTVAYRREFGSVLPPRPATFAALAPTPKPTMERAPALRHRQPAFALVQAIQPIYEAAGTRRTTLAEIGRTVERLRQTQSAATLAEVAWRLGVVPVPTTGPDALRLIRATLEDRWRGGLAGGKPPQPPKPAPVPPRPPEPVVPIVETPFVRPAPVPAIVGRLDAYAEGDRKIKAIADVAAKSAGLEKKQKTVMEKLDTLVGKNLDGKHWTPEEKAEADRLARLAEGLAVQIRMAKASESQRAWDLFAVPIDERIEVRRFSEQAGPESLPQVAAVGANHAEAWFRSHVRRSYAGQSLFFDWKPIPKGAEQRSSASSGRINADADMSTATGVHEMGHLLQYADDDIQRILDEFLAHRMKPGEVAKRFADEFPGYGYKPDEMGIEDDFGRFLPRNTASYAGKTRIPVAEWRNPDGTLKLGIAREVLSIGVEYLYRDPVGFAAKDPQYCKLILGILDGTLR